MHSWYVQRQPRLSPRAARLTHPGTNLPLTYQTSLLLVLLAPVGAWQRGLLAFQEGTFSFARPPRGVSRLSRCHLEIGAPLSQLRWCTVITFTLRPAQPRYGAHLLPPWLASARCSGAVAALIWMLSSVLCITQQTDPFHATLSGVPAHPRSDLMPR